MNIEDAYKLLGVANNISDMDLKQKYRQIAKEKHPDKGGDQEKFKEINEAHQLILDYRQHPEKYQPQSPFINFSDIFSNLGGNKRVQVSDISISISVSFKESVLGVEKPIYFSHRVACAACSATGGKKVSNGCDQCDGFGRVVKHSGNMVFQQNCNKCYGRNITTEKCATCRGVSYVQKDENGVVQVPPGIENGNTLKMEGAGNFIQMSPFGMEASSLLINVSVAEDKEMKKEGIDVASHIKLSMLEAIEGKRQMVQTILGDKEIVIPGFSKNGDFIAIPNLGVKGTQGKHKVYLDVSYPNDIDKLKQFLKGV